MGVDFVLGFSTPPDSGSPGPSGSWSFGGVFSGYFRIMGRNGAGLVGWPPDMGLTGFVEGGLLREAVAVGAAGGVIDSE